MIYKLRSNRVRRTYTGGRKLDEFTGIPAPEARMPEDWTASITSALNGNGDPEGIGVTQDGQLLSDIIGADEYPLLVKLLNSDERLVIQAHPTVAFAREYLNSDYGKTECWYFLDCDDDAYVYIGFKEGVTRAKWEQVFLEQDIPSMTGMLHKVPVKKGDFIFVDGGVPHAIGPGCFMIELQEPSDLMVVAERFTPSGREIPARRMDMGLSFSRMMDVYDYTPMSFQELKQRLMPEPKLLSKGVTEILGSTTTDKFRMLRLCDAGSVEIPKKYAVAICISGNGVLNDTTVVRGDRMLLKQESLITFSGTDEFSVVLCY